MGILHTTDNRLSNLIHLNETFTLELIEILGQNYLAGKIEMGQINYPKPMEFGLIYTIADTEFENVILTFIYKHTDSGNPYEINVEMRYLDSPVEWKISVDDLLISKLPEKMVDEMESEMSKLVVEKFNI